MLAPCRLRPLPPAPTTVTLETVMLLQGEMLRPARDGKGKLTSATCVRARGGGRGRHEPAAVRTVAAGVADFKVLEVDVVDAGEAECVAADADSFGVEIDERVLSLVKTSGRPSRVGHFLFRRGDVALKVVFGVGTSAGGRLGPIPRVGGELRSLPAFCRIRRRGFSPTRSGLPEGCHPHPRRRGRWWPWRAASRRVSTRSRVEASLWTLRGGGW